MADNRNDKHAQIKRNIDKSHVNTDDTRERGADDWMFAHFNQWDETLEEYSDNEFRGQFDIITRQLRQVKGEMLANPISVKFRPANDSNEAKEMSEIYQGAYRASMRTNMAKEAVDVAVDCQVSTGLGAWRIITEYENQEMNDHTQQVIKRIPIHEANNVVYFDSQAKRKDKSDAKWGCILTWYTDEGYEDLKEEYGCDDSRPGSSVMTPATSYVYPWTHAERHYVGEYYEVEEKKKRVMILQRGDEQEFVERKEKEKIAAMIADGFFESGRKTVIERVINKYIVDGLGIIDGPTRIAGKHIPIIPVFGEWRFIEGQEWWEGMVRRAKDPQRLHNMAFSFIADQVGRTPRKKPIFTPEEIIGHEWMYQQDVDTAYYLKNSKDASGAPLPPKPTEYLQGPEINASETAFLQMTEKAVQDVTVTPLVGANAMSDGVTEGQLKLANASNQMQTFLYQDNLATAMRRDGEVWASIFSEISDEQQEIITMSEDDNTKAVVINEPVYDQYGMPSIKNEVTREAGEVYTDIGPKFADAKEEAREKLFELAAALGPQSELGNVALLEYTAMLDVPGDNGLEMFVNKKRLMMGLKQPETEEELIMVQQAQQQPDPQAQLAEAEGQARLMEGQAALKNEENDAFANQIKAMELQLKQQELQIKAAEAGVKIENIEADTVSKQIDNTVKVVGSMQ